MKETSFLAKLLDGERVEWKSLGEVCEVLRGSRLTKKELSDEYQYPVFHGGLIPLGYYNQYNRNANQTMIINTGSIGEVVWSSVDFWSSDGTFVVKTPDEIDDRFLYFFLKINETYFKSQKREGGVPTINREAIANLQIPIPCPENPKKSLEIQAEIVRILDNFTTLTAELTAELTARKKQYNFYRDQLLTFAEGEVEWKPLGDVCELSNTGVDKKINDNEQTITLLNYVDVFRNNYIDNSIPKMQVTASDKKIKDCTALYGDIFITPSSEKIDEIGIASVIMEDLTNTCYSYHIMRLRLKEKNFITSCFIRYCFESDVLRSQILKNATGLTRFGLTKGRFESLQIPLPPIDVQREIVRILDNFDALTNSITEGLPREIELRTKQYEYYRDLLLNFPKNEGVVE